MVLGGVQQINIPFANVWTPVSKPRSLLCEDSTDDAAPLFSLPMRGIKIDAFSVSNFYPAERVWTIDHRAAERKTGERVQLSTSSAYRSIVRLVLCRTSPPSTPFRLFSFGCF